MTESPVRPMVQNIHVSTRFIPVDRFDGAVAENCQKRADGDRDHRHTGDVDPDRHAHRGRGCGCNGTSEPRNEPHRDQKHGRAYTESFDPRRQTIERAFKIHEFGRMAIDPVADCAGCNDPRCIDDHTPERSKDRAVHDRERVRDRKRCGRNDCKNDRRKRNGNVRPYRPYTVFDVGLISNNQRRDGKRKCQQSQAGNAPP